MDERYTVWIAASVQYHDQAYGCCAEVTQAMQLAFPELQRVRGHYYCHIWGERAHWWLVDPDGRVVDPTAIQFPSQGHGEYVPWDESAPTPTGVCLNCGEPCYDHRTCCSDTCDSAMVAEFNHQLRTTWNH